MVHRAQSTAKAMPLPAEAAGYEIPESGPAYSPPALLLVEDDDSDALLAEMALDKTDMDYEVHTLPDGQEVLPYLRRQGKYRNARKPDVMLLDLSLPKKDGFGVLAELAEHSESFGGLAIIILTGDTHSAFLKRSYGLNIVAYVTKPCTPDKIREALKSA